VTAANISGKVSTAETADTASYVLAANVSGKVSTATTADTASYVLASNVSGKVSTATTADTASYVQAANISGVLTATQAPIAFSASWVSASAFITTAQTASYVAASNVVGTVTSASYALSASYYPYVEPTTVPSASWVSASAFITTAQTASYVTASNVIGRVATALSASWASASISASFATTASYSQDTFSRGGTIYDPLGIAGTAALTQNVIIWRAPFACTITNIWGYRVTGSSAAVNARINGIGTIATGSHISLTSADTWTSASSLISSSVASGDKIEMMLVSSSAYPTQIAVQIDFTK
jgi:hypothetical protein